MIRYSAAVFFLGASLSLHAQTKSADPRVLADKILNDKDIDSVLSKATELVARGFTAGTGYPEIWIRDFNTFINASLTTVSADDIKEKLLLFFRYQGADGNIVDGLVPKNKANGGYDYIYSKLDSNYAAHKNTVETDQESSLIQAVKKYIDHTKDTSFLNVRVGEATVWERMMAALAFLNKERFAAKYGLVKGATTIDWGDVQPEKGWGVKINEHTKWSIDIYDNAMLLIALKDMIALNTTDVAAQNKLRSDAAALSQNIRKHLWDDAAKKYRPHIYLNGSPFTPSFNEDKILYLGGTTCAVLAGLHSRVEVALINKQFVRAADAEPHATIGYTVFPPYPSDVFPNMASYTYQNGGDWDWFGGRMIQALVRDEMYQEAYDELRPMLERVLLQKGFYEWWDVKTGQPKGSAEFRGSAGVLFDAINELRAWAKAVK